MEWWHYLLLLLCGLAAGFIDSIAGGGGLLTVPALLWAGLPPQTALGTNKMQACCGTALAVRNYAHAGLISWPEIRVGVACTLISAVLGAWVLTLTDPEFLRRLVPWLLIAIATYIGVSPGMGHVGSRARVSPIVFAILAGAVLGFYDGFFGPGTGSFWTVACVLFLGLDLRHATGYTKAMNLTSNLASLAVFLAAGHVRFDVAAVMIAGQLTGAQLGSGMVVKKGAVIVRPVLLMTAVALAGKLLIDEWFAM